MISGKTFPGLSNSRVGVGGAKGGKKVARPLRHFVMQTAGGTKAHLYMQLDIKHRPFSRHGSNMAWEAWSQASPPDCPAHWAAQQLRGRSRRLQASQHHTLAKGGGDLDTLTKTDAGEQHPATTHFHSHPLSLAPTPRSRKPSRARCVGTTFTGRLIQRANLALHQRTTTAPAK